jgi:hypothetical protein
VLPATIEQLSFPFAITSLAVGDFIWDREHRMEIALLSADGSVHLLQRNDEFRMQNDELKTTSLFVHHSSFIIHHSSFGGLVRVRVSSLPVDNLVVVDSANHQLHILSDLRPQTSDLGSSTTHPFTPSPLHPLTVSLDTEGAPVAVLPMRLNVDALSDLVILKEGQGGPAVALTAPLLTFTVDSTADTADFSPGDGVCDTDDSAGDGPCTLRAAIEETNNLGGADMIDFNIGTGTPTISPLSALPTITDSLTIDGSAGPGGSTRVEIDGTGVATASDGLNITAGSSTVRALVINDFNSDGIELATSGTNVIEDCYLGTDSTGNAAGPGNTLAGIRVNGVSNNTIGGTTTAQRNVIGSNGGSGVAIQNTGSTMNMVEGNHVGIGADGTTTLANSAGVFITGLSGGGSNNTVGGTTTTPGTPPGNVISGNSGNGVEFETATSNVVEGNLIGTNSGGTLDRGNTQSGVLARVASSDNTIGGMTSGERNVISGNNQQGVRITDSGSTGNLVQGNFIGVDINCDPSGTCTGLANTNNGVLIQTDADDNTVGGTGVTPGDCDGPCNVIRSNLDDGVSIPTSTSTGNAVQANSIAVNGNTGTDIGIDLGTSDVTANDLDDPDTGANNLQNNPVMTTVRIDPTGDLVIEYSVDSTTGNSLYPLTIEFFEAGSAGAEVQGRTFLGSDTYPSARAELSDVANLGNAALLGVSSGDPIVATATDASGNTSEFSSPSVAEGTGTPPTAVEVSSFTARTTVEGAVAIDWETVTEINLASFNVLRSQGANGPYAQVNTELIPAQSSGSPTGARYQFIDRGAVPRQTYYYQLQVIRLDGSREVVGPIRVTVPRRQGNTEVQ